MFMRVSMNNNINIPRNNNVKTKSKPAFGALYLYGGSSYLLERVLSPNERELLLRLIDRQKDNPCDIFIESLRNYKEKLEATIAYPIHRGLGEMAKQKFFESHMHFIERCCEIADHYRD